MDHNEFKCLIDMQFIGGSLKTSHDSIANTIDDQLYQAARSGMSNYQFSIQNNGLYKITLHFAELQHNATGERIFDVQIEDSLVLEDFDIYNEIGSFSALVKSTFIEVKDEQLDIAFQSRTGEPCISAIEIFHSPILAVEPIAMKFGSILTRRDFSIVNVGNVDLNWSAKNQNNESWLKELLPNYGIIAPFDTQLVSVTIDRAELADSFYEGSIIIETDGGDQKISMAF